jgi:hypothetical protein
MAASSSLDTETEAAGPELKDSGYTIAATAHAVDTGMAPRRINKLAGVLASLWF